MKTTGPSRNVFLRVSAIAGSLHFFNASLMSAPPEIDELQSLVAAASEPDRAVWWSAVERLGALALEVPTLRDEIWQRTLVNSLGMRFVRVPAGTFTMGPDTHRIFDIQKAHTVKISRAYYVAATEVTNAQFTAVFPSYRADLNYSPDPDTPAVNVTWEEAAEFCKRLSEREGVLYRLPTEAEWEYACRASTTTPFSFGTDPTFMPDYGRCLGTYSVAGPVASFRPNSWGVYDMHGNTFEWVSDWFSHSYYSDCADKEVVVNPTGPESGRSHVLRSCGWQTQNAPGCMCTARFPLPDLDKKPFAPGPGMRSTIGFRIVRELRQEDDR